MMVQSGNSTNSIGIYFILYVMNPITASLSDSTDCIAGFTSSLIDISKQCIPKTSTNPKKSSPWYNVDCKEAINEEKNL